LQFVHCTDSTILTHTQAMTSSNAALVESNSPIHTEAFDIVVSISALHGMGNDIDIAATKDTTTLVI